MKILTYIDLSEGMIKKASLEAACYAAETAKLLNGNVDAIVLGSCKDDLSTLGKYGINAVYHIADAALDSFDAQVQANVVAQAMEQINASVLVCSANPNGKAVSSRLSMRIKAGLVSGAVALPDVSNGFTVKKSVFSGKAFAHIQIKSEKKIISVNPNAFGIKTNEGVAKIESIDVTIPTPSIKVNEVNKVSGEVPLTEADIVVSGGRGLKGPENWGLVTDLAQALGAATACSRPVADVHWRPHHEHVGQTGIAIAPNLYIAIGISGAIQHLAGVNRSKTIVVINKDAEAPFFKAADYGIVGDAFEVVPKLTEAIKKMKS